MPTVAASHRVRRFRRLLMDWYAASARPLPWRETHDPYRVLVSEIMLQQTQVSRVEPLYLAFVERFPTVADLAAASAAEVLTMWRGLGYNRRALSLQRAAQAIVERHDGKVPADLTALLALPGIGAYTARAVLAFGFGIDAAPVDTNVARVLARAVAGDPLRPGAVQALADEIVPRGRGREWSNALMDLGARHCNARIPDCAGCPVAAACAWRLGGGDDPAAAERRRPQVPFAGSDRFHRGRLVDALRRGPLAQEDLPRAGEVDDPVKAAAIAHGLIRDGLAEWHEGMLRLPH